MRVFPRTIYLKNSNKSPRRLIVFLFFFTWWLIGCGRLKEAGVYLVSQKLRNRITYCMQIYGATSFLRALGGCGALEETGHLFEFSW